MDRWYAIQVVTGREGDVASGLCRCGIRAIAPACSRWERTDGQWATVVRRAIPGYVFVFCRMTTLLYYHLSGKAGVIRILGQGGEHWTAIPPEQIRWIEAINAAYGRGLTGESAGVREPDGSVRITSGPLVALSDRIVKIDARRRRATVEIELYDETYQIDMGITVESPEDPTTDTNSEKQPADAEG